METRLFAPAEPRTWRALLRRSDTWEAAGEDKAALEAARDAHDLASEKRHNKGIAACRARVAALIERLDRARAHVCDSSRHALPEASSGRQQRRQPHDGAPGGARSGLQA